MYCPALTIIKFGGVKGIMALLFFFFFSFMDEKVTLYNILVPLEIVLQVGSLGDGLNSL